MGAVFFLEKIFLNVFVDFDRAQAAHGFGAILRNAQHWGFRCVVAFTAAIVLFAYVRGDGILTETDARVRLAPIRVGWILSHLVLVIALAPLSYLLYRETASNLSFAVVVALWVMVGAAATIAAILAMAPRALWFGAARVLGVIWWYAAIAALLGTGAMQMTQRLWTPTAVLTFDLVRRSLTPIVPTLSADPANMVLSTDHFAVQIADVCSGLEGVGLMLAFSGAWLLYFRREYIFPRALLLVPAGVIAIFALNVLRIAALILIGNAGFPTVAIYGFHSQAGWIAFNTVACGLVFVSRGSTWLNRTAAISATSQATDNPTATYLMPLLGILAAGAVSRAVSGSFEYCYPLRLIVGLGVLARYRHKLALVDWRWSWRGPALGVIIFALWMVGAHFLLPPAAMPEKLAAMSPGWRGTWIAGRVMAAVVAVPIAEELAYRGFLMRRLCSPDFESVPYQSVGWLPLTVTAGVFGLAHGALWFPGIIAGLGFGLILVRRGNLGEAVAAHVTANALVAVSVLCVGQWQLW